MPAMRSAAETIDSTRVPASSPFGRAGCLLLVCAGIVAACGGGDSTNGNSGPVGTSGTGGGTSGGPTGAAGDGIITVIPPDGGFGGSNGNSDGGSIIGVLPPDFTKAEAGGYKLGQPIMPSFMNVYDDPTIASVNGV